MGEVIDIESRVEHTVSEVICIRCCKRWISARPSSLLLKNMECPYCKAFGAVIETGQDLEVGENAST